MEGKREVIVNKKARKRNNQSVRNLYVGLSKIKKDYVRLEFDKFRHD